MTVLAFRGQPDAPIARSGAQFAHIHDLAYIGDGETLCAFCQREETFVTRSWSVILINESPWFPTQADAGDRGCLHAKS